MDLIKSEFNLEKELNQYEKHPNTYWVNKHKDYDIAYKQYISILEFENEVIFWYKKGKISVQEVNKLLKQTSNIKNKVIQRQDIIKSINNVENRNYKILFENYSEERLDKKKNYNILLDNDYVKYLDKKKK